MKPVRLQRSRAPGSRLTSPNGLAVVCVTRPGILGNPFRVGKNGITTKADAVEAFRAYMKTEDARPLREAGRRLLQNANVACWCKLTEPCHGDVWLEIARDPKERQ